MIKSTGTNQAKENNTQTITVSRICITYTYALRLSRFL